MRRENGGKDTEASSYHWADPHQRDQRDRTKLPNKKRSELSKGPEKLHSAVNRELLQSLLLTLHPETCSKEASRELPPLANSVPGGVLPRNKKKKKKTHTHETKQKVIQPPGDVRPSRLKPTVTTVEFPDTLGLGSGHSGETERMRPPTSNIKTDVPSPRTFFLSFFQKQTRIPPSPLFLLVSWSKVLIKRGTSFFVFFLINAVRNKKAGKRITSII